jgi:hypothetical protein
MAQAQKCGCLFHFSQSLFRVLKDKGLQKVYVHGEEEAPASSHRTSPQFKVTVFPL